MDKQLTRYLVGVDAGATKTHYVLYDREKDTIRRITGGPANHEVLDGGFEELYTVLHHQFELLLAPEGISPKDIAGAALGMGGVDTRAQHEIISGILRKLGLTRFALANDACLGIKAETDIGTGICAVNGSGFSVFGIDQMGNTAQIGGFGALSGDLGGGSYYASQVLATVYGALYKGEPDTAMRPLVMELFGESEPLALVEAVSAGMNSAERPAFIRSLCQLLFQCAGQGDCQAQRIFDWSAAAYAGAIRGVARQLPLLNDVEKEVILVGSIFTKGEDPYLIRRLDRLLNPVKSCFALKIITSDPVAGALYWAHETAGWAIGDNVRLHYQELVRIFK